VNNRLHSPVAPPVQRGDGTGTAATLDEVMQRTGTLLQELLAGEQDLPGADLRDAMHLSTTLPLALPERGADLETVFARLGAVLAATPSTSSWRFLNQLFAGREPMGLAAEILSATRNVSMYTFKAAGAQVLVENEVLRHMLRKVGLADGEGCFMPGGSLANLTAMLLARHQVDPAARDQGLERRRFTVYTSAEGHYSIRKSAGILGLGRDNVRAIPTLADGRMDVEALRQAIVADLAQSLRPMMVVATAGTTVRGAFDPLVEIAGLARRHGAWLHVDAALGGSMVLSPAHAHLLRGAHLADSLTWNPHKMMGVSLQASVLLVARRGLLAGSLDESADYLFQADSDELNPGHRSLQCGRRCDAIKLWAAWQHLGDAGWATRIGQQMALAARAAAMIAADPEFLLSESPPSINVCFEVRDRSSVEICERLDREGRLKIGHGDVRGRRVIRLACVNPALSERDLAAILDEIKAVAHATPPAS
jgi:glutamate/tyrosine decarboxylase-like PLP-dependent enzyme